MFGDRAYSVLLVSGSEKLLQSLLQIVPELNGVQLSTAFSVSAARREMTAKSFDMVIVNAGSSAGTEDFTVHILRELGTVLIHCPSARRDGKPVRH